MTSIDNGIGDDGTDTELGPERLNATGPDNAGVSPPAGVSPMKTLDQVADLVRNCTDCPLSGGRTIPAVA